MSPPILRSLLRTTPSLSPIPHRTILSVSGSQAVSFLNGVLAKSILDYRPGYTAILSAQGRVLHDLFAYVKTEDNGARSFLLEIDASPGEATPLLAVLKRYVLRSKVKIRDVSDEYDVWAAWGSEKDSVPESARQWLWSASGCIEPVWKEDSPWPWGSEDLAVLDRRAAGMGRRLLVRKGDTPSDRATHDLLPPSEYLVHRLLNGVPEGSTDIIPTHAFPMDSNLDVMGGLDFRKGCYVGQELTVRTYHTGIVRKRTLPVLIHDPSTSTSDLTSLLGQKFNSNLDIRPHHTQDSMGRPRPRGTGKLLTTYNGLGLALLRLEHVEAALRGELQLRLYSPDLDLQAAVSPWWPEWWPKQAKRLSFCKNIRQSIFTVMGNGNMQPQRKLVHALIYRVVK